MVRKIIRIVISEFMCIVLLAVCIIPGKVYTADMVYLSNTSIFPDKCGGFVIITRDNTKYYINHVSADGSVYDVSADSIAVSSVNFCGTDAVLLSYARNTIVIVTCNVYSGKTESTLITHKDINIKEPLVCIDRNRNIYLADRKNKELYICNHTGELMGTISLPSYARDIFTDGCAYNVYCLTDSGIVNVGTNILTGGEIPSGQIGCGGEYYYSGQDVYTLSSTEGFKRIYHTGFPLVCRTLTDLYAAEDSTIYRIDDNDNISVYCDTGVQIKNLYVSGNTVAYTDSDNRLFLAESSCMIPVQTDHPTFYPKMITSSELKIEGKYISAVKQGMTVSQLKSKLNYGDYEIVVYDHNGRTVKSGTVGSGWKFVFSGGGNETELITVVKGDVTGEGQINRNDYKKVSDYITGKTDLNEVELNASDINSDGKTDLSDFYLIYRSSVYG